MKIIYLAMILMTFELSAGCAVDGEDAADLPQIDAYTRSLRVVSGYVPLLNDSGHSWDGSSYPDPYVAGFWWGLGGWQRAPGDDSLDETDSIGYVTFHKSPAWWFQVGQLLHIQLRDNDNEGDDTICRCEFRVPEGAGTYGVQCTNTWTPCKDLVIEQNYVQ